jgi:hypothetical protein
MALFAPLCPHCGAPAPSVEALRTGYRCTYCDRVVDATPSPAAPPPAPAPAASVPEYRPAVAERAPAAPINVPTLAGPAKSKSGVGCVPPVMVGALVLFLLVSPKTCATFLLSEETGSAMDAVRKCPRATELLGNDVSPAWVGCATGQSKSGCDSGSGNWRMPVSGSRASGTLQIHASKNKKGWRATSVFLEVGETRIDVMQCKDLAKSDDD